MKLTWGSNDGGAGYAHASGQQEFEESGELNSVEESVGFRLEDVHIERFDVGVVDTFNTDLAVNILDIDLVFGHGRAQEVAQSGGSFVGNVTDHSGHLINLINCMLINYLLPLLYSYC